MEELLWSNGAVIAIPGWEGGRRVGIGSVVSKLHCNTGIFVGVLIFATLV